VRRAIDGGRGREAAVHRRGRRPRATHRAGPRPGRGGARARRDQRGRLGGRERVGARDPRARGRARQQRRRVPRGAAGGDLADRLPAGDRRQPDRRVPRHARARADHVRATGRLDRQRLLARRLDGQSLPGRVRSQQVGRAGHHQGRRQGAGEGWRTRQLGAPRPDRHRHECAPARAHPRADRQADPERADAAHRHAGGGRERDRVPRERRERVRDRRGARDRRRHERVIIRPHGRAPSPRMLLRPLADGSSGELVAHIAPGPAWTSGAKRVQSDRRLGPRGPAKPIWSLAGAGRLGGGGDGHRG